MNGTQQRNHRTALNDLARGVQAFATATVTDLETLKQQILALKREHEDRLDAEQHRLDRTCEFCDERWDASTQATKRLADRHQLFVGRPFWQRLRWLLRGY